MSSFRSTWFHKVPAMPAVAMTMIDKEPRRRDGIIPISDAIARWKRAHPKGGMLADLRREWEKAAGARARVTRPKALRAGRLSVEVASSAVLSELATLRKAEFLSAVQAVEPRVAEISFSVGDGPWETPA